MTNRLSLHKKNIFVARKMLGEPRAMDPARLVARSEFYTRDKPMAQAFPVCRPAFIPIKATSEFLELQGEIARQSIVANRN